MKPLNEMPQSRAVAGNVIQWPTYVAGLNQAAFPTESTNSKPSEQDRELMSDRPIHTQRYGRLDSAPPTEA